jgi:hypothetical protein
LAAEDLDQVFVRADGRLGFHRSTPPLQLVLLGIGVGRVIGILTRGDDLRSRSFQRAPKPSGIADSTKGRDAPACQPGDRLLLSFVADQLQRSMHDLSPRRLRRHVGYALPDRCPLWLVDEIRSGEHDDVGSLQSLHRLAEQSAGDEMVETEGDESIEQDNIQVAMQTTVLEGIVEQ